MKEKGTLIHSLCKMENDEEGILYTSFADLFESMLMFVTKTGFIKLVSGVEFETNRQMVAATKLDEGDEVAALQMLSAGEVLSGSKKVVILTEKGLSLGFQLGKLANLRKQAGVSRQSRWRQETGWLLQRHWKRMQRHLNIMERH